MEIKLLDADASLTETKRIWTSLESRGNASYFLSWPWVEQWLTSLPAEAKPRLAVGQEGGEAVLAFFLGEKRLYGLNWRYPVGARVAWEEKIRESLFTGRHLFSRRAWFVNATGDTHWDRLHVEYNGFLSKIQETAQLQELLRALPEGWEELYLQGFDEKLLPGDLCPASLRPCGLVIDRRQSAPFVDLALVRAKGGDYLSCLSANTRSQIKKAYRLAGKETLSFQVAATRTEAVNIYQELITWHERSWRARGGEGAFATSFFREFHEGLIEKRFDAGEIQLCRLTRRGETAACLYNFVYRGRVFFYQSGVNYELDPGGKHGYLAHVEAIRHNLDAGRQIYDFLGGQERYKESLATGQNHLLWLRIQKPLVKFAFERFIKKGVRQLQGKK